ncbi:MAG: LPS assembly lipoprotein LptE [Limisphaerales bacterium]
MKPLPRPVRLVLALLPLFAGCAGYRLGPTGGQVAGARSVSVAPFANETIEPRLSDAVTGALRASLQQDGTFQLATRDGADVEVRGRITRYVRDSVSVQPGDVITPTDYRIRIYAHVTATEAGSGRRLLDREVRGYTTIRIGSDQAMAEEQALPNLAANLARNVTSLLVDGEF